MQNVVVRARIDENIKNEATLVLSGMGLTVSDAVRMLMTKIAHEKTMPFDISPNATTLAAMKELEEGKGIHHANAKALFEDFGI
jgi:DNA-damage-inducible protein J